MVIFDSKAFGVIVSGRQLLLEKVSESDDITFTASFTVLGNLKCEKKVTALFDLVVLGDINVFDLEVKGRLVCLGDCYVENTLIVQTDIWAENLESSTLICHDRVIAQSLDVKELSAEGNIITGKALAIQNKAQTPQMVICGETAYGSGKLIAKKVLTADPLDLDEGEDAIEDPFYYEADKANGWGNGAIREISKYRDSNDYRGVINKLLEVSDERTAKVYSRFLNTLNYVEEAYKSQFSGFADIADLLWLIEASTNDYFKDWPTIQQWTNALRQHFVEIVEGKIEAPPMVTTDKLLPGYVVFYSKYGRGTVIDIINSQVAGKQAQIAVVEFEEVGIKKFSLPQSLSFFKLISTSEDSMQSQPKLPIKCTISSYSEWLLALEIIEIYKEFLGEKLYNIILEQLLSDVGLKPKFLADRIKEKGWN